MIAERVGNVTQPGLVLERACDYLDPVPPEQPEVPDVTILRDAPQTGTVRKWIATWKPVRVRLRGRWEIGIVRDQVQMPDGSWALRVEHATGGMHDAWHSSTWIMHDKLLVLPVEADPPQ